MTKMQFLQFRKMQFLQFRQFSVDVSKETNTLYYKQISTQSTELLHFPFKHNAHFTYKYLAVGGNTVHTTLICLSKL